MAAGLRHSLQLPANLLPSLRRSSLLPAATATAPHPPALPVLRTSPHPSASPPPSCRSAPEIKAPTIDAKGFLAPELQGTPPPKEASCCSRRVCCPLKLTAPLLAAASCRRPTGPPLALRRLRKPSTMRALSTAASSWSTTGSAWTCLRKCKRRRATTLLCRGTPRRGVGGVVEGRALSSNLPTYLHRSSLRQLAMRMSRLLLPLWNLGRNVAAGAADRC